MAQSTVNLADAKSGKWDSSNGSGKAISDQIALLQNDLQGLAKEVSGLTRNKLDQAVAGLQDAAADKADEFNASVRRNPMQATAIAAGVGFVMALLLTR